MYALLLNAVGSREFIYYCILDILQLSEDVDLLFSYVSTDPGRDFYDSCFMNHYLNFPLVKAKHGLAHAILNEDHLFRLSLYF